MESPPIRVNRAPVLTLWAAVVAERLGHPPDTALSLASAVAGTAARAKARRLGLAEEHHGDAPAPPPRQTVRLLGREVPVTETAEGLLAADPDGKPARPAAVKAYVTRAFGERLAEVRAAMEGLAAGLAPEELNRTGFRLYEGFRPEVPADVTGWGAKGMLALERIRQAAD
ncbi:hypothetical protein ACFQS7_21895 [Dankookia sp. GCM10030260]|uniref:hypothetical protein n=1 Tax=Dankookia sp. GCM10030260 TaxID=3273390 RepID=UPI00361C5A6E